MSLVGADSVEPKPHLRLHPVALRFALAGAVLGIVLLHPVMEAVFWFGSHDRVVSATSSLWRAIAARLLLAFTPGMLPMTGLFAVLGGAIGLGFGLPASRLGDTRGRMSWRTDHPARELEGLISEGEGERVEFKATARWDQHLGRVNRALEEAIARTIAGFLNHEGGTLLIGVSDTGCIVGCEADFQTLKRQDRDGFQQFLMGLVQSKLGGHVCAQIHVGFCAVQGKHVFRIDVAPSTTPVYCQDGSVARFFVRTGNGTRELDVREALVHVSQREQSRSLHPG